MLYNHHSAVQYNPPRVAYSHHVIAHGKALATCLSERRPLSDSKYKRTFFEYDMYKGKIFLSGHHVEQPPVGLQALPVCITTRTTSEFGVQ